MLSREVLSLLAGKNFASIATVLPDGSPQVTNVWIDYDVDHNILINTAMGRVKEKNTRKNKKVAISITNSSNPYETASIMGEVVEKITMGAQEHFDHLTKKYMNLEKYPISNPFEERVILKIRPQKVFHISIPLLKYMNP
jgi:PPOX class probable F420-dependent enzyme